MPGSCRSFGAFHQIVDLLSLQGCRSCSSLPRDPEPFVVFSPYLHVNSASVLLLSLLSFFSLVAVSVKQLKSVLGTRKQTICISSNVVLCLAIQIGPPAAEDDEYIRTSKCVVTESAATWRQRHPTLTV